MVPIICVVLKNAEIRTDNMGANRVAMTCNSQVQNIWARRQRADFDSTLDQSIKKLCPIFPHN
jgi:hypothetical protein